ncbi:gamma-glutamyl-gamma-aminobutyrate hydrolase family protein [Leuconostoc palmae]|uniref:gamma-glutamyl-gamma-aminobutyrate hydrolase family protein n=1 Tax=Leuconostoc palmae TaxID=501487 RepID=UPI001C7D8C3B|nr:gamma-glutamyl-gamma-aminobutyrate hydrolase family protein [Leuconostoc palmae]
MKKIGISSNHVVHANPRFGTNYVNYVQKNYIAGITGAGALPMVLPLGKPELAEAYIDSVDALLLPGGQDVSPDYYGEDPIPQIGEIDRQRDLFELALLKEAIRAGKPVFGICRGAQVINVAMGGTLYQDLPTQYPKLTVKHDQYPTKWSTPTHRVSWERSNWLDDAVSPEALINSFHHQAIKDLADGLVVDAKSFDGVIEAFSNDDKKIYGIQWHPEMLLMTNPEAQKIFDAFVNKI